MGRKPFLFWWRSFISNGSSFQLTSGTGIWHMLQMDRQQYPYSCNVLALLFLAHAASWPAESRFAGWFDFPQLSYKARGQGRWGEKGVVGEGGRHNWLIHAYSTEPKFSLGGYSIPDSNFLHVKALPLNSVLRKVFAVVILWFHDSITYVHQQQNCHKKIYLFQGTYFLKRKINKNPWLLAPKSNTKFFAYFSFVLMWLK